MPLAESARSVVNTWECDENAHMNVQFYFAHFDAAGRQFEQSAGLDGAERKVRHVRYHAELRAAESIVIKSAIVPGGPHPVTVVHEMHELVSGRLAATALDSYRPADTFVPDQRYTISDIPEAAMPHSFQAAPQTGEPRSQELLDAGGAVTFRGALHPLQADCSGNALDQTFISCVSNGAPHAWEHGGLSARWLAEQGFGRVAVEMKLSCVNGLKAGDLVHMITRFTGASRKAFTFSHYLFDSRSDRLGAVVEAAGLAMDLATRRAVELPQEVGDRIQSLIDAGKSLE